MAGLRIEDLGFRVKGWGFGVCGDLRVERVQEEAEPCCSPCCSCSRFGFEVQVLGLFRV